MRATRCFGPGHRLLVLAIVGLSAGCGDDLVTPTPDLPGRIAYVQHTTGSSPDAFFDRVVIRTLATGEEEVLVTVAGSAGLYIEGMTWTADGRSFVLAMRRSVADGADAHWLARHTADGGGGSRIFDREGPELFPAFSADGRLAYQSGWSTDSLSGLYVDGTFVADVSLGGSPAWFPDGAAVLAGRGVGLRRITVPDGTAEVVVPRLGQDDILEDPDVSGAGRIAFMRFGAWADRQEIWVADADGANPRRLTTGHSDHSPAWSPDGTRLAFIRDREVQMLDPDEEGEPVLARIGSGWLSDLVWLR